MTARWSVAVLALLVASVSVSHAQMRLMGLERFYFDHMAGPGDGLPGLLLVLDSLPDNLRWPAAEAAEDEDGTIVQDFPIPGFNEDRQVWIREIRVTTKSGIDVLWWALYDRGLRSDLWTFTANPRRHDGKALSDYRLRAILQETSETALDGPGSVILQVRAEFDAPEGWRRSGFEWVIQEANDSLVVASARTAFDLYRPAAEEGVLQASAETFAGDNVVSSRVNASPAILEKCGLSDPGDLAWEFAWPELLEATQCLLSDPGVVRSTRSVTDPTSIERGSSE